MSETPEITGGTVSGVAVGVGVGVSVGVGVAVAVGKGVGVDVGVNEGETTTTLGDVFAETSFEVSPPQAANARHMPARSKNLNLCLVKK